jgi:restriction system protein
VAFFLLVPRFLGGSLGQVLSGFWPVGLLLVASGGFLLWLGKWTASKGSLSPSALTPPIARSVKTGKPVLTATASPASPSACGDGNGEGAGPNVDHRQAASASPAARPTAWSAAVFEVIEWRRFEALIEALFAQAGFVTQSQSHGADSGIDIWLFWRSHPEEPVSLVQCKHWQGRPVGVDKVRELRGVMASRGVKRGQFATTSTFTPDAQEFAHKNGIHLLDMHGLLSLISQRTIEQQRALLEVALEGDYWRPTCVNCGVKMVDKASRADGKRFWGCQNFPTCRKTMRMRST